MCNSGWTASDGLVVLENGMPEVLRRLDASFLNLAKAMQASEMVFPAITPVSQLAPIDYFKNFPHLGLAVCALSAARFGNPLEQASTSLGHLGVDLLSDAHYMLPSAACYPIYAHLRDRTLTSPQYVTTVQRCFRNENHYEGMRRLLGFTMREIVAVGSYEDVRDYLERGKDCVLALAEAAGLNLEVQKAQDPFFESTNGRSRTQKMLGLKLELVFDGSVAVSSINSHMGFFGERWGIRLEPSVYAYSGCIAFGLERWLHALCATHGDDDPVNMLRAIEKGENAAISRLRCGQSLPRAQQSEVLRVP